MILRSDSYKSSHYRQYPPGMTSMFCYLESRGGKFRETKFFGLQYLLKKYMQAPTRSVVIHAHTVLNHHGLPFNWEGWGYIADLGYLPLAIRAVPEGTVVPVQNASLELTSDDPEVELPFKLHDFGARGVSSGESAAIGGCAHLVNFKGTDTLEALEFASEYYDEPMAGFSIPAAEHSTITSWGQENEVAAYSNMLDKFQGMVAVVSDSYDIYNAIDHIWGETLRQRVADRSAALVIRPDSGDPINMVPQVLTRLAAKFGTTTNSKGFKVLNHVRVIQGDGVDIDSIRKILQATESLGFSTTNLAFGSGGALLQKVDRDTQKFAYKCSSVVVNGERRDVFKDPVTDPGKRSKTGVLDLLKWDEGDYRTVNYRGSDKTALRDVWVNGRLKFDDSLETIRNR